MGMKQMLSNMVADAGAHTPLLRKRANRVAPILSNRWDQELGVGQSWVPLSYGEYYPRSATIYAAIKARHEALARVQRRRFAGDGVVMSHTAEDLKAFVHANQGVSPENLDPVEMARAGVSQRVVLVPGDQDTKVRYFGNLLVQMVCNRKDRSSPLSVELHTIATALSYLLNSTSFVDGEYHPFDKDEIDRKLRRTP